MQNYAGFECSADEGTDSEEEQAVPTLPAAVALPEVTFASSKRGKHKMVLCGHHTFQFRYRAKECRVAVEQTLDVYGCVSSKCPARLWLKGEECIKATLVHNHEADPIDYESRQVKERAVQLVRADPLVCSVWRAEGKIGDHINAALDGRDEEVVADVDKENLRRQCARERAKVFQIPAGRTDPYHLSIPMEWQQLKNGDNFLIVDNGRCKDRLHNGAEHEHTDACKDRVLIFSTPYMIKLFARHSRRSWAGDGTFYSKPGKQWSQLYCFHAGVNGQFVPAIAVIMGRATTGNYLTVLQAIGEYIKLATGEDWQPGTFHSDFEQAIRSAVERQFGGTVEHKGCFFHFFKAIFDHAKKEGLQAYESAPDFYMFLRCFAALALIPTEHVDPAFDALKLHANTFTDPQYAGLSTFLIYFEKTWVRRGTVGRYYDALFPKVLWNHSQTVKDGGTRTTAALEEWHKDVNSGIDKYPAKTVWYLMMFLKKQFESHSPHRITQLESPAQNRRGAKQKAAREKKLLDAVTDFDPSDSRASLLKIARASRYNEHKRVLGATDAEQEGEL